MEKARLIQTGWNEQAEWLLQGATGSDPTYTIAELRSEIAAGTAQLVAGWQGDNLLGYLVLHVEEFGGNKELVVKAGAALSSDRKALAAVMPALRKLCVENGCMSMRAHVEKRAYKSLFESLGFRLAEYVVRTVV